MDQRIFAELLESTTEALEHAKGKRELRTTELPPPPSPVDATGVRRLRAPKDVPGRACSRPERQHEAGSGVGVWPSHARRPALLLVRLMEVNPALVLSSRALVRRSRARVRRDSTSADRARRSGRRAVPAAPSA